MGVLGTLGSLNVLLSADTTTFTSSMEKAAYVADRNFSKIAYRGKMTMAAISAAAAATATALAVAVNKSIQHADDLGKMAQAIGLTTQELSGLEYAAKLSNVSLEELRVSFQKFDKAIYDGAKGSKEQKEAFRVLGVSITDAAGNVRNNYDLFTDTADALSKIENSAQKTALAMVLFGKSGASMIPLLNGGKAGIQDLTKEAERMGLIISGSTAKSAELFNDNMTRLAETTRGLINRFTEGMLPALTSFSEKMVAASRDTSAFSLAAETLGRSIGDISKAGLAGPIGILSENLKALPDYFNLSAAGPIGSFTVGIVGAADSATKLAETTQTASEKTEQLNTVMVESEEKAKRLKRAGDGIGDAFGTAFEDAIVEGKKFRDVMLSLLQDIQKALIRSLITDQISSAISSGLSGMFSGGGKTTPAPTKSAHGNVFSGGSVVPFASGGLITRPSLFPMANGGVGLAGEAGTEAIMPLFRGSNGDLGVKGAGGRGVEINVYAPPGSKVSQNQQSKGDMDQINIMIDEAAAGAVKDPGSKTHRALKNSFGLRQSLTPR